MKVYPSVRVTSYLLLGQLDLVELLHVLLIVLLLELPDEAQLLLWAVGVLLSSVLLELHCCLRIQSCHYLLSGTGHRRRVGEEGNKGNGEETMVDSGKFSGFNTEKSWGEYEDRHLCCECTALELKRQNSCRYQCQRSVMIMYTSRKCR